LYVYNSRYKAVYIVNRSREELLILHLHRQLHICTSRYKTDFIFNCTTHSIEDTEIFDLIGLQHLFVNTQKERNRNRNRQSCHKTWHS